MSFGRPSGISDIVKLAPPQRGSFPLDHDGKSPQKTLLGKKKTLTCLTIHRRVQRRDEAIHEVPQGKRTRSREMPSIVKRLSGM